MYHRIADSDLDPWRLCVSPSHFDEQLEALNQRGLLTTLDEVAFGTLPSRPAVVLTLDDGYADTLTDARPVLDRHQAPIVIYVTTAGLPGDMACWWDVLAELLLRPGRLPSRLAPDFAPSALEHLAEQAVEYRAADAERHARWSASEAPPTARHALYLGLWRWLVVANWPQQLHRMEALRQWAGRAGTPEARLLDGDEVLALHADPLVTIGAHTDHHLALPALDPEDRRVEIIGNLRWLERLTGGPIAHFAYPYGRYDRAVVDTVRGAGFVTSVTTDPTLVHRDADLFSLPRVQVPDLDGDRFSRWLESVFSVPGIA